MDKTLKVFSVVVSVATLGSYMEASASALAPGDDAATPRHPLSVVALSAPDTPGCSPATQPPLSAGASANPIAPSSDEIVLRYRMALVGDDPQFPYNVEGFSRMEERHTWSIGDHGSIVIPTTFAGRHLVQVTLPDTTALISPQHPKQTVGVRVNWTRHTTNYVYTLNDPTHDIVVTFPEDPTGNVASTSIQFFTPDSCVASDAVPGSIDPRKLGLSVNSIVTKYVKVEKSQASEKAQPTRPAAAPDCLSELITRRNEAFVITRDVFRNNFIVYRDAATTPEQNERRTKHLKLVDELLTDHPSLINESMYHYLETGEDPHYLAHPACFKGLKEALEAKGLTLENLK